MSHGPDYSDSDDSLFSDDGDYANFKERVKIIKNPPDQPTEQQKREQELKTFFCAISSGNKSAVLEFFDNGIEVNVDLGDRWTPILIAASYGNPEITRIMIENGADVNSDRDGVTTLMMACNCPEYTTPFEKSLEVVKLLVEKGANVNFVNRKRMTALMYAATIGNLEAVKFLLPLSNKLAEDNQKWTALFWAVSGNHPDVVEYLINQNFDTESVDVRGNKPLDIAKDNEFEKIISLFPEDEYDTILNIIDQNQCSYEENFENLQPGERPNFFLDVFNVLCAIKCDSLVKIFHEEKVKLSDFLALSESELKKLGVMFPFQRNRVLVGLYRFHKQMYHPKSIHHVPLTEPYSNNDVAIQILSALKQIIAMESSLQFIKKQYNGEELSTKEILALKHATKSIKSRLKLCKLLANKLCEKVENWDHAIRPPDLITKKSIKSKIPWKKIMFSVSVISIIIFRICK